MRQENLGSDDRKALQEVEASTHCSKKKEKKEKKKTWEVTTASASRSGGKHTL